MHVIHASHAKPVRLPRQPLAWLQIQRGGTRFPLRPILASRFLIGAGTNCHLQTGGESPMLHSLLMRQPQGWVLEAIAPEPALLVNGDPCRHGNVQPGDVIQIGPLQMQLCVSAPVPGSSRPLARLAHRAS